MLRRALLLLQCLLLLAAVPASAGPLDVSVKEIRTPSAAVTATLELRDLVPDRFKKMIDGGEVLHLRVQTELWESQPVWDRLVYPAIVRVFRLSRLSGRDISMTEAGGMPTPIGDPWPVVVDLGSRTRVAASSRYYVHVQATLGTLADREADAISDAVFGRGAEADSLGSLGRLLFRTALQVSDYLQSVTAEATSRRIAGRDVLQK
jgi:hypothetical protein